MGLPAPSLGSKAGKLTASGDSVAILKNVVTQFIEGVVNYAVGGLAILMLMVSAYMLMFARGDQQKVSTARKGMVASLMGLAFLGVYKQIPGFIDAKAGSVSGVIKTQPIINLANMLIEFVEMGVMIMATAAIIYAGYMYMTSSENDNRASDGVKAIQGAALGLFFVGTSRFIFEGVLGAGKGSIDVSKFHSLISGVINIALEISGLVAVALLVYAGFELIISGGEKGKNTIINVIIGLFLLLVSYGFVQIVYEAIS